MLYESILLVACLLMCFHTAKTQSGHIDKRSIVIFIAPYPNCHQGKKRAEAAPSLGNITLTGLCLDALVITFRNPETSRGNPNSGDAIAGRSTN